MDKSYEKVIEYVKDGIVDGDIAVGDKLPPERDMAAELKISRNSAREGLRILENMGVLESRQGAGNYISGSFDDMVAEMLSFMYILKQLDVDKITEFRSTLEFGALEIGIPRAYLLIEATDNQCMTVTYKALDKIMDEYIPRMRSKIIEGMHSEQYLSRAHRTLAEGFAEGKVYKAREGLELHFKYIHQYM